MSRTIAHKQKTAFLCGEGDGYFLRNRRQQRGLSKGYKIYLKYLRPGAKVLEIGCSNGHNLDTFCRRRQCEGYGIEPSSEAVLEGRSKCPNLNLHVGTADDLPFKNGSFDMVIFGFCLYLVDRALLKKTVSEADRVLKKGGYLGITDFDVKKPMSRLYTHCPGVRSYKMEYWKLFDAMPGYALVEKSAFSHNGGHFVEDAQERLSSVVLYKEKIGKK